ncbi:MAG: hypothetical protein ACOYJD_00525 [Christensenellales bacterium]
MPIGDPDGGVVGGMVMVGSVGIGVGVSGGPSGTTRSIMLVEASLTCISP